MKPPSVTVDEVYPDDGSTALDYIADSILVHRSPAIKLPAHLSCHRLLPATGSHGFPAMSSLRFRAIRPPSRLPQYRPGGSASLPSSFLPFRQPRRAFDSGMLKPQPAPASCQDGFPSGASGFRFGDGRRSCRATLPSLAASVAHRKGPDRQGPGTEKETP